MNPVSANLIPWNPEYGSIATLAYQHLTGLSNFDHNTYARNLGKPPRHIQIQISGIPPHLCTHTTVNTLLDKLAIVQEIILNPTNHRYIVFAKTHCLDVIPPTAAIGIKRMLDGKLLFNIWPILYEIIEINNQHTGTSCHEQLEQPIRLGFMEECYSPRPDDEATSKHHYTDIENFSPIHNSSDHECGFESDRSMNY
ncbi:hypothetical protein BDA96_09G104700 [Sorghum bicolor]|uniref:Uncharacterized protein n=2 Tax=Sorghum bicolor TaxID=4558 RepID=A0A921U4M6_SORBI|nr:hypothetical protein BDA96_09G104700 [Sorghum bicolor]KXG21731.1 hypothetical protein SORBI_3009G100700 [Sorghum bicolor]